MIYLCGNRTTCDKFNFDGVIVCMSYISENPGILPYYVYGTETDTPFQTGMHTPRVFRVPDGFSFNNGTAAPATTERTEIRLPLTAESNQLLYLDLGHLEKDDAYDTVLLLDGAFISASVFLNGYAAAVIKDTLMGEMVIIDGYLRSSNRMYILFGQASSGRDNILRSVRVVKLKKSRITDISVKSRLTGSSAEIVCDTTVISGDIKASLGGSIEVLLLDRAGTELLLAKRAVAAFTRNYWQAIRLGFVLDNARLWSCDDPYRYTVRVRFLLYDGSVSDMKEIPYGIRELSMRRYSKRNAASPALLLNDIPLRIRGIVAGEHDGRLPGKLKAAGINAVRVLNPYNRAFFEACDNEGILVMCEAYADVNAERRSLFGSRRKNTDPLDTSLALLGEMIIRLKNYASVFCWSVGIRKPFGNTVIGEFIHSLDNTRTINCQGDSSFALSDFFSADDCELQQLELVESHSFVFEGNILGIHYSPRVYRNYPFLLCDVDVDQENIGQKIGIFNRCRRFLGLFLSSSDGNPVKAAAELLKESAPDDK